MQSKKLKEKNTCEGEVEKVDVGGGPHVLVLDDHQAGGQVAQHTKHEKHAADIHNDSSFLLCFIQWKFVRFLAMISNVISTFCKDIGGKVYLLCLLGDSLQRIVIIQFALFTLVSKDHSLVENKMINLYL